MTKQPEIQPGSTQSDPTLAVVVTKDGPYVLVGAPPLALQTIEIGKQGQPWDYSSGQSFATEDGAALCRCGHSRNKPFCDGSHETAGEDLSETASHGPMFAQAEQFAGPELDLKDSRPLCAVARFCHNGKTIWKEVKQAGQDHADLTALMAHRCPSGRLVVFDADSEQAIEEALRPSLSLLQDPQKGVSGPLVLRGGIRVEGADGESYEIRNRQALCRCGKSGNKPFCDGSHVKAGFKDGLG